MKEIGGYFELHLDASRQLPYDGIYFNSGCSALEYFLLNRKPCEVWLPEYICPSLISVIKRVGTKLKWYAVDYQLNPIIDQKVFSSKNIVVVIVNYFGIRSDLLKKYHQFRNLIIWDLSQAFYCKLPPENSGFYSPRKFFGIPDGGILLDSALNTAMHLNLPTSNSVDKFLHLIKRIESGAAAGHEEFKNANNLLGKEGMKLMSNLSKTLIRSIDFAKVARQRLANYHTLHKSLSATNELLLPNHIKEAPMVYPYKLSNKKAIQLRAYLIRHSVFVATYWPFEKKAMFIHRSHILANSIIPLPIDQRYGHKEMLDIINLIGAMHKK